MPSVVHRSHAPGRSGPALGCRLWMLSPPGVLYDDSDHLRCGFPASIPLGTRNRVVWGLGYRYTHDAVIEAPALAFLPPILDRNLFSTFVQDEIALRNNLSLTLGTKLEHNDYTGFEFEPDARLSWNLNSKSGSVGRYFPRGTHSVAHRSRAFGRLAAVFRGPQGRRRLHLRIGDRLRTRLSRAVGSTLSASVSTFYNQYDDVRSTSITPTTMLPFFFANDLEGRHVRAGIQRRLPDLGDLVAARGLHPAKGTSACQTRPV